MEHKFNKIVIAGALALSLTTGLTGCSAGNNAGIATTQTTAAVQDTAAEMTSAAAAQTSAEETSGIAETQTEQKPDDSNFKPGANGGSDINIDKSADTDLQKMISAYADKFTVESYTDQETGLTVPYDLYLPADYDASKKYPLVVFIGDMRTVGTDMEFSLTQGWGGLVWADLTKVSEECIIAVPVYPETVLDDHGSYTTTDYLTLTPRMIRTIAGNYAVDESRIYGTGQSMGAMTTLFTAAQNPDLYSGVLIVDGQWDVTTLKGLEGQNIMYLAAGGDDKASGGQEEIKAMLKADGVAYSKVSDVDAQDSEDKVNGIVQKLICEGNSINFLTWKSGTVREGISANIDSEHMASFDYGYKFSAIRDWLLNQRTMIEKKIAPPTGEISLSGKDWLEQVNSFVVFIALLLYV